MTSIKNESLVQRIINKITDSIIAGELKPGDKLPTEMELIAAFGVGKILALYDPLKPAVLRFLRGAQAQ